MSANRFLSFAFLLTLSVSFLYPQSLAEIAKRERERRAKLKGRTAVVVTNADLAKMKKKPAVEVAPVPSEPALESTEEAEPSVPTAAETPEAPTTAAPSSEGGPPPDIKALQDRWEKAKEYVELLTLKMTALWQQFYGLVDAGAKEAVQQAIGETFIKLQNAQEEETRVRLELENLVQQQKEGSTPPIWIR